MRSRQNPNPATAEETIRRTQQATEVAVQLAPARTGAEARRLVGSAAYGRRSRCILSTFAASARRDVALGLPAGGFVFLSAQTRSPFTEHEKASYCSLYESHLLASDTTVSYSLNADPLLEGTQGETHRRFHAEGCQQQPAFAFQSDEPEFHHGRSRFGLWLNQLRDGVMQAFTAPFCLFGLSHVAFLWAVSKNKPFAASHNGGCLLIRTKVPVELACHHMGRTGNDIFRYNNEPSAHTWVRAVD